MKKQVIVSTQRSYCVSYLNRIYNEVWFSSVRYFYCCILLLAGLLLAASHAEAGVKVGDILVTDYAGGTDGRGALVAVDPATGQRRILSDFGDAVQGSFGSSPLSVAVFRCKLDERAESASSKSENRNPHDCSDGEIVQIYVSDSGRALFKVDPNTGHRTLVSDFGQGDIEGAFYYGLAVNAKGKVIANLSKQVLPNLEGHSVLVRIDPETDARVLVSDLFNPDQGAIDTGTFITDLVIEHSGKILIGTANENDYASGAIFRVSPRTGKRKLLSDLTNAAQGPIIAGLFFSAGLATETSKQILAIGGSFLLRIDPKTGQRTILSDFDNSAQGITGFAPRGTVVEKSGKIVVSAVMTEFYSSLFRVDPKTGQRTLLSDSANPEQGPPLTASITYMAIVPKNGDVED